MSRARRLDVVRAWAGAIDTTGLVVLREGERLIELGDTTTPVKVGSVRKSILALLYGRPVAAGIIRLDATLAELGIDDVSGLTIEERQATVWDLLTGRSGVYHPAANGGDHRAFAPARGTQRPGAYFLYNNWDFNAAGTVFETATGRSVHSAVFDDLARPLGMRSYDPRRESKSGDATTSMHLAYHLHLSTADLALVGALVLAAGSWDGDQIVPVGWIERVTSVVTPFAAMNPPHKFDLGTGRRWGYGAMWWVWDAPDGEGPFSGACTARGSGGQFLTVLPRLGLVVAHTTDPSVGRSDHAPTERSVSWSEYMALLAMLVAVP